MPRISINAVPTQLAEAINAVAHGEEPIVIYRRGKSLAAIVSIDDLQLLRRLEDALDGDTAMRTKKSKGSISFAALKRKAGLG